MNIKLFFILIGLVFQCPIVLSERSSGCKIDIVIILDSSGSVGPGHYTKMKIFCKNLLQKVDLDSENIRVGILSYSTDVNIEFHLNSYNSSQTIMDAIEDIEYKAGYTNTALGLKTMRTKLFNDSTGDREDVPNVCLILTDGVSNYNSSRTIPEAKEAREAGIHIYAIGIGLKDTTEIDAIVSVPAVNNSFKIQKFDELAALSDKVFQAFCSASKEQTPKVCYCPCSKVKNKWSHLAGLNLTYSELKEAMKDDLAKLEKELSVDKKKTSSAIRRRTSAPDDRKSSANMGVFAVILTCLPIFFCVCIDCTRCCCRGSKKRKRS